MFFFFFLSVEDWHFKNKHFIQSETSKESARKLKTQFTYFWTEKKKIRAIPNPCLEHIKSGNHLSEEGGRISQGSELRLNSLTCSLKPEALHPTQSQGPTITVIPIKAAVTGENSNLSSCLHLWFLPYMVWSSVTKNLRSDTNNSQQGFRLESKSTDSAIHYLQDCAKESHKGDVLGFSLDTERVDDGKEVRVQTRMHMLRNVWLNLTMLLK